MDENGTTVKQKILAEIRRRSDNRGRVSITPDGLAKLFGLNGHDLAKNLDQLRQEGFLDFRWGEGNRIRRVKLRRGRLNEDALGHKPKSRSIPERVRQWVLSQPQQRDGWVWATTSQIRDALGLEGNVVSVAVNNMTEAGHLETRKQGYRVVAIRIARPEASSTLRAPTEARSDAVPEAPPAPARRELPDEPEVLVQLRALRGVLDSPFITLHQVEIRALEPLLDYVDALRDLVDSH